jgi:hypothetical protein
VPKPKALSHIVIIIKLPKLDMKNPKRRGGGGGGGGVVGMGVYPTTSIIISTPHSGGQWWFLKKKKKNENFENEKKFGANFRILVKPKKSNQIKSKNKSVQQIQAFN